MGVSDLCLWVLKARGCKGLDVEVCPRDAEASQGQRLARGKVFAVWAFGVQGTGVGGWFKAPTQGRQLWTPSLREQAGETGMLGAAFCSGRHVHPPPPPSLQPPSWAARVRGLI